MSVGLSLVIDHGVVLAALKGLGSEMTNERVLKVLGIRFLDHVNESFRTRGRGTWRPLAPSTLALRTRGGDAPLQDSGDYRKSFVQEIGPDYVEVGSNQKTRSGAPLGEIHEFGTRPYTIRAIRDKRGLMARTRGGKWMFFGREVHHPGVSARPVLPTLGEASTTIQETIAAMYTQILDRAEANNGRG